MAPEIDVTIIQNEITVTADWDEREITVTVSRGATSATAPLVLATDGTLSIPAATASVPGHMTATQAEKLDGLSAEIPPVTRAAGNYSLDASDVGTQQVLAGASAITIPANVIQVGRFVGFIGPATGEVSFVASGVTFLPADKLKIDGPHQQVVMYCTDTNVISIAGSLKA